MNLNTPEGNAPPNRRHVMTGSLFFTGYAAAAASASADPVATSADGLIVENVQFSGANEYHLPAYVARPSAPGARPAIIVVNEIFGIHDYIKDVCRRFAREGYVAIAPDYFDRAGDPAPLTDFTAIREIVAAAGHEQTMLDTEGALAWLAQRSFVNANAIGVTGFCWGGAITWMAAARFSAIKAGVAWYGRLVGPEPGGFLYEEGRPWPVDIGGLLQTPVLGLYASEDQGIPVSTVEQMRASLLAADNPSGSEIIVYEGAAHGFHADYRASYNAEAARDGWSRALAWFRANGVG
jgi:carboxymethylenebutenolidase